jgi:hypothetical protein
MKFLVVVDPDDLVVVDPDPEICVATLSTNCYEKGIY